MIITTHVTRYGKSVPVETLSKNSHIKVDVQCPSCLVVRNVHYSGVCRSGHTYCQKCSVAAATEKRLPVGSKYNYLTCLESTRSGYSMFSCDCGNVKEISNYAVTSGSTKACGCLRKSNRVLADTTGENHPNWKGGVSGDRERFMQTAIYKAWRLDVFERDEFTCVTCGQVGYELEAHHLEPYHSNEHLRTDANNGVTLCKGCHNEFHNQYGRLDFCAKDFLKFKQLGK